MWKFHDFSITQILREIKFGRSRSSKNADFAIFGALNFINLLDRYQPAKSAKMPKNRNSEPLNVLKWQILRL